jgi:hypothetical protein
MKYEVELAMTRIGNCWCQKPQLTGILCDHLLVVCSFRRLNYTRYISPYYIIQYYINRWSSHWRSYDNIRDWSMTNGTIIRPDPVKINKERRRKICIPLLWFVFNIIHKHKKNLGSSFKLNPKSWNRIWSSIQAIWANFQTNYIIFIYLFLLFTKKYLWAD